MLLTTVPPAMANGAKRSGHRNDLFDFLDFLGHHQQRVVVAGRRGGGVTLVVAPRERNPSSRGTSYNRSCSSFVIIW